MSGNMKMNTAHIYSRWRIASTNIHKLNRKKRRKTGLLKAWIGSEKRLMRVCSMQLLQRVQLLVRRHACFHFLDQWHGALQHIFLGLAWKWIHLEMHRRDRIAVFVMQRNGREHYIELLVFAD